MKPVLALAAAILTTQAAAFDYHGIQSGMTVEEASISLRVRGVSEDADGYVSLLDTTLAGVKPSPSSLSFSYDHEGKLYALELNYYSSDLREQTGISLIEPYKRAFLQKYKALAEFDGSSLEVKLVDEDRFEDYLKHQAQELMKTL